MPSIPRNDPQLLVLIHGHVRFGIIYGPMHMHRYDLLTNMVHNDGLNDDNFVNKIGGFDNISPNAPELYFVNKNRRYWYLCMCVSALYNAFLGG